MEALLWKGSIRSTKFDVMMFFIQSLIQRNTKEPIWWQLITIAVQSPRVKAYSANVDDGHTWLLLSMPGYFEAGINQQTMHKPISNKGRGMLGWPNKKKIERFHALNRAQGICPSKFHQIFVAKIALVPQSRDFTSICHWTRLRPRLPLIWPWPREEKACARHFELRVRLNASTDRNYTQIDNFKGKSFAN